MEEENRITRLLEDIKYLLGTTKKVMNVDDLAKYTGLSKSKIYKLTQLKLIPTGNNKHIRQKFFDKDVIDAWLMGKPNLSDEYLEQEFNKQLFKNKKKTNY
ncbi:helix-turn-helix transcriptional regulator [Flagellimonas sp. 2504JD4-2]